MIDQDELIRRAKEVARDLDLSYMEVSDAYHPEDDDPFGGNVSRLMVVNSTDDGEDVWVDFVDTLEGVAAWLKEFVKDEWGFDELYDLARDDYATPVELDYSVALHVKQGD